jgi:flavin-dependent dehydrogenase
MDAHGSWDRGPRFGAQAGTREPPRCDSDLFAFKARFLRSALEPGFLPVLAIDGGYGGMVVSDNDRTTVACCVRRDVLRRHRQSAPGASAGSTMEVLLRRSCNEVRRLLDGAERDGPWLSVGPIRPGLRLRPDDPLFRIGNAAGETHPLTGEGISMALQSAALLASELRQIPPDAMTPGRHAEIQHRYNSAWRRAFGRRLLVAGGYAQIAMHPLVSRQVGALFHRWPQLLTQAASWAGKARSGYLVSYPNSVTP